MAITYTLFVDYEKVEDIYTSLKKIAIKYEKTIIQKELALERYSYELDLFEEKGFTIFFAKNPKKIIYKGFEFTSFYSITFRFDKFGKFSDINYNMMTIISALLAYNKFNYYILVFEGETVILSKIGTSEISLNNNNGFWNDDQLENLFKNFSIEVVNEVDEVDYYPIRDHKG